MKKLVTDNEKSVIMAFSEVFLDTSLEECTVRNIQKTMNESGLPEQQLKEIFLKDVSFHLLSNLKATAGTWTNFDRDWLLTKVEKRRQLRRRFRFIDIYDGLVARWNERQMQEEISRIFRETSLK